MYKYFSRDSKEFRGNIVEIYIYTSITIARNQIFVKTSRPERDGSHFADNIHECIF